MMNDIGLHGPAKGLDLNLIGIDLYTSRPTSEDEKNEQRADGFCTDHGLFSEEAVCHLCPSISRRAQGQIVLVPRSVPVHGLRPVDVERKFA